MIHPIAVSFLNLFPQTFTRLINAYLTKESSTGGMTGGGQSLYIEDYTQFNGQYHGKLKEQFYYTISSTLTRVIDESEYFCNYQHGKHKRKFIGITSVVRGVKTFIHIYKKGQRMENVE